MSFFFCNETATTEFYTYGHTLSLPDALPIYSRRRSQSLVSYGHELSRHHRVARDVRLHRQVGRRLVALRRSGKIAPADGLAPTRLRSRLEPPARSEEHTSELQSLMRISYAVFCLKKKKHKIQSTIQQAESQHTH